MSTKGQRIDVKKPIHCNYVNERTNISWIIERLEFPSPAYALRTATSGFTGYI